jgi:hypothetical protein
LISFPVTRYGIANWSTGHIDVKGTAVSNIIIQWQETNGHYPHQPVIAEFQGHISKAEAALQVKEEENVMLKQQLEQYEKKWSEYEVKMKSMEEAWKRQLSSLQVLYLLLICSSIFLNLLVFLFKGMDEQI